MTDYCKKGNYAQFEHMEGSFARKHLFYVADIVNRRGISGQQKLLRINVSFVDQIPTASVGDLVYVAPFLLSRA